MDDEAARVLAEVEDRVEAWLCELDAEWTRLLEDGRATAERVVAAARDEAEIVLAAARADATRLVASGHADAARVVADAQSRAGEIVGRAEADARSLLAGSARLAGIQLAEARAEVERSKALAHESSATAHALAFAADAAASGRVRVDDLASLGTAVHRLRAELSRVVDAAFDALPAVEATAAALGLEEPEAVEQPAPAKRGVLRRLVRRG